MAAADYAIPNESINPTVARQQATVGRSACRIEDVAES